MQFACPQCQVLNTGSQHSINEWAECCADAPEGMQCKPDGVPRVFDTNSSQLENDDTQGCEKYRFPHGLDEMAINAEIGLYFDFQVPNIVSQNITKSDHVVMA